VLHLVIPIRLTSQCQLATDLYNGRIKPVSEAYIKIEQIID